MTTKKPVVLKCACCGKESTHPVLTPINARIAADLDLRPAERNRPPMDLMVRRCPHCGYCSNELNAAPKNIKAMMKSPDIKKMLESKKYPELVKRFLIAGRLAHFSLNMAGAVKNYISAAWACDDAKEDGLAAECRIMAAEVFKDIRKSDFYYFENYFQDYCLVVDLYRRAEKFNEALKYCNKGLEEVKEEEAQNSIENSSMIKIILMFQKELIQKKDTGIHKIEEVDPAEHEDPVGELIDLGPQEYDPIEDNPRYWEIMREADIKAHKECAVYVQRYAFGYCHAFWGEKKKVLKEESGIEWKSPSELNPHIQYD